MIFCQLKSQGVVIHIFYLLIDTFYCGQIKSCNFRPAHRFVGLIRCAAGWSVVKAMRRAKDHMKSDERILGDGDFTQSALYEVRERLEERNQLKAQG